MKKIFTLLLISFYAVNALSQIEMFDESVQKVDTPKVLPYDSLRNFSTQKYGTPQKYRFTMHHLVGQTIMYCGDPYGYYSPFKYEKGAYYRIDGVLPDDVGRGLYHRLKITNIKTGEQTELGGLSSDGRNYKWVVVGHYEKMKSLYENKDFVYVGTNNVFIDNEWAKANGMINLETDTITKGIPEKSLWTCVGVQVKPRKKDDDMDIDKRSPIVLIFDNPTYGKHYCYLEDKSGAPYRTLSGDARPLVCGRFLLKSYYDVYVANKAKRKAELAKKYGVSNANLIIDGKVRIGMTKAMCRESWGQPDDVNTSIGSWGTHEQWVYGSSYLYFEGNKLTAIQN